MGGQASIDPPPSSGVLPFFFLLFLFFISFSTRPRQMGINRKSRKQLENKLVVKCSRLNFYFKRNFWNTRRDRHISHKNFEAWALWMWSSKLRWRVRRRMSAAQMEDKRSKTLQMNGTNKCSAVNTTWHLYRKANPCSMWLFLFAGKGLSKRFEGSRLAVLTYNEYNKAKTSISLLGNITAIVTILFYSSNRPAFPP